MMHSRRRFTGRAHGSRGRHAMIAVAVVALAAAVSACAPEDNTTATQPSASGADACAVDNLHVITPGTLTIATSSPAYAPWFTHNDPSNGKGFEGAVAKVVWEQLGFSADQVTWVVEPFNKSFAPGDKDFDFDINQISILPARAKVVDFSDGYFDVSQGVVALDDSGLQLGSLDDLRQARLGAQQGTTSLLAAQAIDPSTDVAIFGDTNDAKQALQNGQIDAVVADLDTALYISAVEIPGSSVVGQFATTGSDPEQFGLLFQKGNPLVTCVNEALDTLRQNGTLDQLQTKWLADSANIPVLK